MDKMYSKKEIAEELGVSKSTVYRLIRANSIDYERRQGQTMLYSQSSVDRLKSLLSQQKSGNQFTSESVPESVRNSSYVQQLQHENQQQADMIKWLQQQLEEKEHTLQLTIADNHQLHQQLKLDDHSKPLKQSSDDHAAAQTGSYQVQKETTNDKNKRHWWQWWK